MASEPFADALARWSLIPDGAPFATHSSHLMPVRFHGMPAMLKISRDEEKLGGLLMQWWNGDGAARVRAYAGDAVLLERLEGPRSLAAMARNGQDDEASRIICSVAARLHAPRGKPPPPHLIPLTTWFEPLRRVAARRGDRWLSDAAALAKALLSEPKDEVVLHGDLHHDNVLDGGTRGWLAIDPSRIRGERTFDFANVLRNPEGARALVLDAARFARQATVVAEAAGLNRTRLLQWLFAFCGLSAAWILEDGDDPAFDLAMAKITAAELGFSQTLEARAAT